MSVTRRIRRNRQKQRPLTIPEIKASAMKKHTKAEARQRCGLR